MKIWNLVLYYKRPRFPMVQRIINIHTVWLILMFRADTECDVEKGIYANQSTTYVIKVYIFTIAADVALDILSKQITGLVIPDQHGSSGDVSYDLTGYVIFLFFVYPIACFHMCEYLISFCLLYGMSNLEINHIFCIY